MPFDHFGQFVRLATVPLLITGAAQFVGGLLVALTANSAFYLLWWLIFGLVTIPFCVGWTRFAVLGSDAMRDRSWLSHGTRQLKYLAFSFALTILLFGPSALCVYVSYTRGWSIWLLLLGAAVGLATTWAAWRLTFALPAIALDSFQGLKSAWKQTRSIVLRIMAVVVLAGLPLNCGQSVVEQVTKSTQLLPLLIVLGMADLVLMFLSVAVYSGAVAICYRSRMGSESIKIA